MSEAATYQHKQIGWTLLIPLGLITLVVGYLTYHLYQAGPVVPLAGLVIPLATFLALLTLFCCLTVEVNDESIVVRFGPGLIRKRIPLVDVASCRPVRNRWWYGWGIRWIGRGKWLFNISGLEAVELAMKAGKVYRIGTDEPYKLNELIQSRLNKIGAQR